MFKTGFLFHPDCLKHQTGWRHPEKRSRLVTLIERLKQDGFGDRMTPLSPEPASLDSITAIHDPDYVERIRLACEAGALFEPDAATIGSPGTHRAALLAAGSVLKAADSVMDGQVTNAFCAVRPPGHHAEKDRAMGFCFFNNVAIGAKYLQRHHGIRKVAIIDWDVHHGNGTQQAFYDDPSVFYFSVHQYPHYPQSGRASETGTGPGKGYTLNVPVAAGSTDTDYRRIFMEDLRPAMARFKPEFMLISAGFDGHSRDPLGGVMLTEEGFGELTRLVTEMAAEHCEKRLVSVLEGGYDIEALVTSTEAHLQALMEA
ncbi:MAG: histone deacetylase [bacterium]